MCYGFKSFSPPYFWRVNKELENESREPESEQTQRDYPSEWIKNQRMWIADAEQAHEQYNEGDEERMHIENLFRDEGKWCQFLFPFKVFWNGDVHQLKCK